MIPCTLLKNSFQWCILRTKFPTKLPQMPIVSTNQADKEDGLRGDDEQQLRVFSNVSPEQRVPTDHPLRPWRAIVDGALRELQPRFNKLYAKTGRPSIAPEKLLRALLLQLLYSGQRTDADGATRLQPVVPLVRWTEHGRCSMRCDRVHGDPAPHRLDPNECSNAYRTLPGK